VPQRLLVVAQGGAVAKLVGLRLLRASPSWAPPDLRVICFATPAVGNDALARLVERAGWGGFFKTYVLPGVWARVWLRVYGGGGGVFTSGASSAAAGAVACGHFGAAS
jgi:hypothetical protein